MASAGPPPRFCVGQPAAPLVGRDLAAVCKAAKRLERTLDLLKGGGDCLRVTPEAAIAGAFYLRRLHDDDALTELEPERLAAACLYLACKTEECQQRASDLLNVFLRLRGGGRPLPLARLRALAAPTTTDSSPELLVGEAYYAAKTELIADEQAVLRALGYRLASPAPHRHLLNLCCARRTPPAVTQLACAVITAAMFSSRAVGGAAPTELATAAVRLAAVMLGEPVAGGENADDALAAELLRAACPGCRLDDDARSP